MLSKEKLRKKFIALRKKNYFDSEEIFFKPLINLILKKKEAKYHSTIHQTLNLVP